MTSVVNRYYDPATDQFMSIDPLVGETDQPYVFTNDNPLNSEDPLGESWWNPLSWSGKDWLILGGLVLGVVGAVSGVGAVVALTADAYNLSLGLGVTSLVTGGLATVADSKNCSTSRVACVGAALGAIGVITGSGGIAVADASVTGIALAAFSANVGIAASVYDVTVAVFNPTTMTARPEIVKVTVVPRKPQPPAIHY